MYQSDTIDVTDSIVEVSSWPGAEAAIDTEWATSMIRLSDSSAVSSFTLDDWEKVSLLQANKLLLNQVEVLSALAGRPCSGLARASAVRLQSAARRRIAIKSQREVRSAAVLLQRTFRGWRTRAQVMNEHAAALKLQAAQRIHIARILRKQGEKDYAARQIQSKLQEHVHYITSGPSRTWFRRYQWHSHHTSKTVETRIRAHSFAEHPYWQLMSERYQMAIPRQPHDTITSTSACSMVCDHQCHRPPSISPSIASITEPNHMLPFFPTYM